MINIMFRNRALMKHHQKNDFKKRIALIENSVSVLKFNSGKFKPKTILEISAIKAQVYKKIA